MQGDYPSIFLGDVMKKTGPVIKKFRVSNTGPKAVIICKSNLIKYLFKN